MIKQLIIAAIALLISDTSKIILYTRAIFNIMILA